MSNPYIRAVNKPRVLFNFPNHSVWIARINYNSSNKQLLLANYWTGTYDFNTNIATNLLIPNDNRGTLNSHLYNNSIITIGVEVGLANTVNLNKTILYSTNSSSGTGLTNRYDTISTANLIITGCAVYGNTFYIVVSYTTTPNTLIVMQTNLSTTNPTNPFNTTTPLFTQTYQTFTAASRIYGNYYGGDHSLKKYTGMCAFDTSGNLYITTSGSGVYKYSVNSTFDTNPTLFISSTNYYSTILYNPVFDVFYICNQTLNTTTNISIDVYSGNGDLLKLGFVTGLNMPNTGQGLGTWPICFCCDEYGAFFYEGSSQAAIMIIDKYVCFKKDTLILTLQGYKLIQDLKKGDFVKTLKHQFVPIYKIGFSEIHHPCVENRFLNILCEVKYLIFKRSKNNRGGGRCVV